MEAIALDNKILLNIKETSDLLGIGQIDTVLKMCYNALHNTHLRHSYGVWKNKIGAL